MFLRIWPLQYLSLSPALTCKSCTNNLRIYQSIIHIENPTRCHSVSKFYFIFIWNSACYGWHTSHLQEPKIALAATGFARVEGCWTCSCWTLLVSSNYLSNNPPRMQTRGCYCILGSWWWVVWPKTCWASYKYEKKKILIHCGILLDFLYELY
jgi:hypothetical protein